ncbi:Uu.00g123110.m01.CDS01 [Anthostomella pinea]|uniref:Uu.00g123110.m01.CDS01 n=1 Tax=Anthostomella pinea TaxID=933095 RepID=A0AAI8VHC8_9PEZI|nr:Uu.00g123110.m01.CDS01 [Anthostomella pinea]
MYARSALTLLLAAAGLFSFSAAAASDSDPKPAATAVRNTVKPRQTSDNLLGTLISAANAFKIQACIPGALPLVTQLPPLPKGLVNNDLLTQALSQTTLALSDVCDFSITGAVGDVYTAYLPTWYSWYRAHSATIAKIITACPSASALVTTVEAYESCAQVPKTTATGSGSAATGTETGTATATGATNTAETSTSTTVQGAAAPQETGFMAAAAAAAGLIGAIAVL